MLLPLVANVRLLPPMVIGLAFAPPGTVPTVITPILVIISLFMIMLAAGPVVLALNVTTAPAPGGVLVVQFALSDQRPLFPPTHTAARAASGTTDAIAQNATMNSEQESFLMFDRRKLVFTVMTGESVPFIAVEPAKYASKKVDCTLWQSKRNITAVGEGSSEIHNKD